MKLSEVSQNVLDCRDLNHHWVHEWTLLTDDGLAERVCSCPRCGSTRTELVDMEVGVTVKRRYTHAQDYLSVGKQWKRREYRIENLRRALKPVPKATRTRARKAVTV